jgi:small subunit ribosomal protein S20
MNGTILLKFTRFKGDKMPNLASAKKRLRQNSKRRLHNQIIKTQMKNQTKKALESGDVLAAISVIDRAAAKGVIHRNAAARRKSRLAKKAAAAK